MRRLLPFLTLIVVVLLLVSGYPVQAHANLVRSEPPANAILATSPSEIKLWFSEAIEVSFSQVQIFDRAGQPVKRIGVLLGDPADVKALRVAIQALPDGVYSVAWRTVSAADGHATSGAFAFVIGVDPTSQSALETASIQGNTTTPSPFTPDLFVRWLGYIAMSFLIGGFAFTPLVLQPALAAIRNVPVTPSSVTPESSQPFSQASGLSRLLWIGWGLALLTTLLGTVTQAATSAGVDLTSAVGTPVITFTVGTRYGQIFVWRVVLLVVIYGLLMFRRLPAWRT